MAPHYPEEIDVFSVPHSRMKELVEQYLQLLGETNFSSSVHLTSLLTSLSETFKEFKAHEQIENRFIMRKLRKKMRVHSITNQAVCNCHADNRLSEILHLVRDGFHKSAKTDCDRENYETRLRQALTEFTDKFLPHMKEEEEVFQPLLMKYFSYDELKEIKANVIEQHLLRQELAELTDFLDALTSESSSDDDDCKAADAESSEKDKHQLEITWSETEPVISCLPGEVLLLIFSHLSVRDVSRCAQVCWGWNDLAYHGSLWTRITPVHWANGNWCLEDMSAEKLAEEFYRNRNGRRHVYHDEDADIDETESPSVEGQLLQNKCHRECRLLSGILEHLLPRVGASVLELDLSYSRILTDSMLNKLLDECPNVSVLRLQHCNITDAAFTSDGGYGHDLKHLDLTGCVYITDTTILRLMQSMHGAENIGVNYIKPFSGDIQTQQWQCMRTGCVRNSSSGYCPLRRCRKVTQQILADNKNSTSIECTILTGLRNLSMIASKTQVECDSQNSWCYRNGRNCCRFEQERYCDGRTLRSPREASLEWLSLSGCHRIKDQALRLLRGLNGLPRLRYLDLSGCPLLTGPAICNIVQVCPRLEPDNLFYCDNLSDGPFTQTASGCQNIDNPTLPCCRNGLN